MITNADFSKVVDERNAQASKVAALELENRWLDAENAMRMSAQGTLDDEIQWLQEDKQTLATEVAALDNEIQWLQEDKQTLATEVAAMEATCEFLRESLKANDTLAAENARMRAYISRIAKYYGGGCTHDLAVEAQDILSNDQITNPSTQKL